MLSYLLFFCGMIHAPYVAAQQSPQADPSPPKIELSWDLFRQVVSDRDCNQVELARACRVALATARSTAKSLGVDLINEAASGDFLMQMALIEAHVPKPQDLGYLRLQTMRAYLRAIDPYASVQVLSNVADDEVASGYLGLGVRFIESDNGLEVQDVYGNSPADQAGIFASDRITSVSLNGLPKRTLASLADLQELQEPLAEGSHTTFKFEIENLKGENREVALEQAMIHVPSAELRLGVEAKVGLLRIRSFNDDSLCSQLDSFLGLLKAGDVQDLIIDLRGNPGGDVRVAACSASLFTGPKPIYGTVKINSPIPAINRLYVFEQQSNRPAEPGSVIQWQVGGLPVKFNGNLVLAVDNDTASSAEVFAAALRHHVGARIIGKKTFGKFVAQRFRTLPRNSHLILGWTGELIFQPNGTSLNSQGLLPDMSLDNREIDYCFRAYLSSSFPLVDRCNWIPARLGALGHDQFN